MGAELNFHLTFEDGAVSFLLLLLACSVQVTFCKSVLNLNRPGHEPDTTAMESGLDLNRSGGSVWVLKDKEWIQVNRAHPSAVKDKRSVVDQDYTPYKRSVEVEDQGMDEDYSTAIPDPHRDENIGQEQDTMTMESGLNRFINFCVPLLPCWNIG